MNLQASIYKAMSESVRNSTFLGSQDIRDLMCRLWEALDQNSLTTISMTNKLTNCVRMWESPPIPAPSIQELPCHYGSSMTAAVALSLSENSLPAAVSLTDYVQELPCHYGLSMTAAVAPSENSLAVSLTDYYVQMWDSPPIPDYGSSTTSEASNVSESLKLMFFQK
jgi:hypothetical protein